MWRKIGFSPGQRKTKTNNFCTFTEGITLISARHHAPIEHCNTCTTFQNVLSLMRVRSTYFGQVS
eukprot:TRINITY_DN3442_c0_g1_i1.p1 TRINITY_DN3442_c0_g1~~TRINITY_DN3442_c0_g1_i1.p1  ORF type:complete len:65 (-),score=7.26 TRINITY_DN3442_c0_g1_i1:145-339(-)